MSSFTNVTGVNIWIWLQLMAYLDKDSIP